MRKLAFGYSTRCNIRCGHCVAEGNRPGSRKMDFVRAGEIIPELARAGVGGISFSAGEPFLYFAEISDLVGLCAENRIYTRIVTNSYWADTPIRSDALVAELKERGLCQLRLSFSRWHQKNVNRENVLRAADSCRKSGVDYFISFVTDFSVEDDSFERFLRNHQLKYFPEPLIYAGRADSYPRREIRTDYQPNRCHMNPYLSPDLEMYGCCDAGSHFSATDFFYLGNLNDSSANDLFSKYETDRLYNLIRIVGITNIASYLGMPARKIIAFSKCELCRTLFNSPETLAKMKDEVRQIEDWRR